MLATHTHTHTHTHSLTYISFNEVIFTGCKLSHFILAAIVRVDLRRVLLGSSKRSFQLITANAKMWPRKVACTRLGRLVQS